MFQSLLLIAALGALIICVKRWQSLPPEKRAAFAKKAGLYGAAAAVLGLVLAGRAHWLMGILAGLLALTARAAQFAQYVPMFKKVFGAEQAAKSQGGDNPGSGQAATPKQAMSKRDAADILGVDISASAEDVRLAHKKLMQKIHPDRGGSDALAKQINQAKDILLA